MEMWPTWQPSGKIFLVPGTTLPDAPDEILIGVITVDVKKVLSTSDQKRLEEFHERFERALAKRPRISDEDFLAETEVSDEQYAMGMILPGVGDNKGDTDG